MTWYAHQRVGGSVWMLPALLLPNECAAIVMGSGVAPPTALPLSVRDMYEHSCQIDHGAVALKYVDAFLANVQWEEIDRRFEQAQALHRTLAGVACS
jgi:superoxide dismutase, Fe-Mn family